MFKTKRKLLIEQSKVHNRDILIEDLEKENKKLREENKCLRYDLEEKQLENYNQHRTLFEIEQQLSKPYGSYVSLLKFRTKIKELLNTTDIS